MKMMFTIITVSYNSEKTIAQTMESVLNQSYGNYEYIIIDGGSTDGTVDIVKLYMEKYSDRIKLISEPDKGIYDAMNKGIKLAKGDIIGIINSDDWYERDALINVANNYVDEQYVIYHGYMRTIDALNGKEIRCAIYNPEYIKDTMINHPTVFVHKKIYDDYGAFNLQYKSSADYEFIIRMVQNKKVRFIPINKIQANFRTGGMSGRISSLKETMKIKKKYGMMNYRQYIAATFYLKAKELLGYRTI